MQRAPGAVLRRRRSAARCTAVLVLLLALFARAEAADYQLTDDWGGLRTALSNRGLTLGAQYIGEAFGNLAGGVQRGTIYEGRLSLTLDADLGKLAGWRGASAHASMYQIHGHGPSANLDGNLLDVSGIEALPSTRLFTLWLEQRLLDDRLSLRLGQLAMDDEFVISTTSANLVNSTFGNPFVNAGDMTGGGPVYPLADPGVRLRFAATDDLTLLAAAFAANPAGQCAGVPQVCNPSGTTFSFSGGTLWVAELQYQLNHGKGSSGLPATLKLGAWRETGAFTDQHFGLDPTGATVSLAAPAAVRSLQHHGDFTLYGIWDQMLWRRSGTDDQGVSSFLRLAGAPSDRNLVAFYADTGVSWKAPFANRPDDIAMLGLAYARISRDAAALDRDRAALAPGFPVRDYEGVIELSYLAQLRPWLSLQPDLQYVLHPGGNVLNPAAPPAPIRNALVLGLRTTITF